MKTKLSLLFLLLSTLDVFAQTKPRLVLFTDYASCYYGLKDQNGKQIRKAEFTALNQSCWYRKEQEVHYEFFWIAQKNGFYGALNDSGKVVVPFRFEELKLSNQGYFIARNQEEWTLLSLSGNVSYSEKGVDYIEPVDYGFIIGRKGKAGFLDLSFRERISFEFTKIEPVLLERLQENQIKTHSPYLFRVFKEHTMGIYDLRRGMVVPCDYGFAEVHWVNKSCPESQAVYEAFKDTALFIYNSEGIAAKNESLHHSHEYYFVPLDSCGSKAQSFVLFRSHTSEGIFLGTYVVNLLTREQSMEYDLVTAKGNRFLCKKGKRWSVMDEHFKELAYWSKWNASWEPRLTEVFNPLENTHAWQSLDRNDWKKNALKENQLVTVYANPSKGSEYLGFGLYDYENNKRTSLDYYRIIKLEFQQKWVYWAFKVDKQNRKYLGNELPPDFSQLDIYDEKLNLLRSFKGEEALPFLDERSYPDFSGKLIVHRHGDSYGAINARGEQVIPAKYEDRGEVHFGDPVKKKEDEVFYLFGNKNLLGVFNGEGILLIPEKHQQYMGSGTCFIALNEDRTYTVYSKSGQLLLEGINAYWQTTKVNGKRTCSYLKQDPDLTKDLVFFTKGKELYYLLGEKILKAGPETFGFTSRYLRLSYQIIIDQQGEVTDVAGLNLTHWGNGCAVELQKLPLQEVFKPGTENPVRRDEAYKFRWIRETDPKTQQTWWTATTSSGAKISKQRFDYPLNLLREEGKIFRVQGKYGVVGEELNELLPPLCDYIYPVRKGYILYKDSLWSYWQDGKFSPEAYDAVSVALWQNGSHFVFKNGKIGILTDSLTYLLPLTDSADLIRKTDLVQLLGVSEHTFYFESIYYVNRQILPETLYRGMSNERIVWQAYEQSTDRLTLNIEPVDRRVFRDPLKICFRENETRNSRVLGVRSPFYYSEKQESMTCYVTNSNEVHVKESTIRTCNYRIVNNQLKPITLNDLITGGTASMKKLDDHLIQKLNREQYFGPNCTDISGKLEVLKNHFLISHDHIRFYWPEHEKFQVDIYFREIEHLLPKGFETQTRIQTRSKH